MFLWAIVAKLNNPIPKLCASFILLSRNKLLQQGEVYMILCVTMYNNYENNAGGVLTFVEICLKYSLWSVFSIIAKFCATE